MRHPNHRPRFKDPLELLPRGLTKLIQHLGQFGLSICVQRT